MNYYSSNRNKKVNIVLPVYNGEKYLKQSIDSCLNQTYKNIELIIVNDGSKDRTEKIIKSYRDKRIKYIQHNENKGLPFALNSGFKISTGEYLSWTSYDNFYAPNAIEIMVNFLEKNHDVDFVYSNYYLVDETGKILKKKRTSHPKLLDLYNCIGPCFLYRRKIYETIGEYNSCYTLVEDYEYWLRIRERYKMKKINDFLYYYRIHYKTLTKNYSNLFIEKQAEEASKKYIPQKAFYYHRAKIYFFEKNYGKAAKLFLKSIFFYPYSSHLFKMFFLSLINFFSQFLLNKKRNKI
jgi:glycosyltransferase involved in cell wall biosynthesis